MKEPVQRTGSFRLQDHHKITAIGNICFLHNVANCGLYRGFPDAQCLCDGLVGHAKGRLLGNFSLAGGQIHGNIPIDDAFAETPRSAAASFTVIMGSLMPSPSVVRVFTPCLPYYTTAIFGLQYICAQTIDFAQRNLYAICIPIIKGVLLWLKQFRTSCK